MSAPRPWGSGPAWLSAPQPSRALHRDHGGELIGGPGLAGLTPGIVGRLSRGLHRRIERGRQPLTVVDHHRADAFDAEPLDEGVGALLVLCILAVELDEAA